MADDQKPKTMDINDLVRELSKSSTSPVTPTPPLAPSSQAPKPSFPTSKPPMPPPLAGSPPVSSVPKPSVPAVPTPPPVSSSLPKPVMPQPKFNVPPPPFSQPSQPKPASPPPVSGTSPSPTPTPPPAPGVKEYQSSIRTMNEDISKLKQGQKPTGIAVPRKVEQVIPPSTPQPTPAKPPMPSPQFKVPSVNLGEAQKTGPLAQVKDFSKPVAPSPRMAEPTKPKAEPKTQIYVPQEGQKGGGNRNLLFVGIGAVAVLAGFAYWFFVLRPSAPEIVIMSPTPTPTATPTPTISLSSIFKNISNVPFSTNIVSTIGKATISGGEFQYISSLPALDLALLLDSEGIKHPPGLADLQKSEFLLLVYGQKEIFDSKGQLKTNAMVEKRLVFINEVKDAATASQLGRTWEAEMPDNLQAVLQLDSKKQASQDFLDNSYRGVNIRYKNFSYSDRSIDYAVVVSSSNGKPYIVIGGSRESVYAAIDKLKGF